MGVRFCQKCHDENRFNTLMCWCGYEAIKDEYNGQDMKCLMANCDCLLIDIGFPNEDFIALRTITDDVKLLEAMIELYKTDIIEYETKMSHFRNEAEQKKILRKQQYDQQIQQQREVKAQQTQSKNVTKCPVCGSTNIQLVRRKYSLLTGFLTNKVDRVCVNCKYKF